MKRGLIFVLLLIIGIGGLGGWYVYSVIYGPSVQIEDGEADFYLPSGIAIKGVLDSLASKGFIKDTGEFAWVARKMNYPNHIHAGRYILQDKMSNHELVTMLRSGADQPVRLTLNQFKNEEALAAYVDRQLEADSARIMELLKNDQRITNEWGFSSENLMSLFIADTYEFHWNTKAKTFLERMYKEYQKFWNERRKEKASQIGLSPQEVSILASIVQKESSKTKEWDTIAGVYLNRLEQGWPLESDPTVIYALKKEKGMDSVKRVYKKYTKVSSPYNTYQKRGLPPGPLMMPDKAAIEAVLNAPDHQYMFFVAGPDLSGGHRFSKTLREHNNKAREYHQSLNDRKIY